MGYISGVFTCIVLFLIIAYVCAKVFEQPLLVKHFVGAFFVSLLSWPGLFLSMGIGLIFLIIVLVAEFGDKEVTFKFKKKK